MRIAIAATAGAAAALVAASMLGVASAEAPIATPTRTVSVEGVSILPIAQGSSAATATGVYRQAMAAAESDGQSKAEFLASKVGATLGGAQSIAEAGGDISCTSEETGYAEYQGEQPDFGYAPASVGVVRAGSGIAAPRSSAPALGKPTAKSRKHHKVPVGKAATSSSCKLSAQVLLVYAMS
jgi:hypothetical protein